MNDILVNIVFWTISIFVVAIIGAFVNSWWKRPKLSIKINHNRNQTFFLKPIDPDLKWKGETKPLPEIFIQIGLSIYNVGDDTVILNAQLKYKNPTRYSDSHPFVDHKGGMMYYTTQDSAIGTNESMLGKNKKVEVSKKIHSEGYLSFEVPFEGIPDYIEVRLKITPVKGLPKSNCFKIYEHQPS